MTNERITGLYHGGRQIGDASGDSGIAHHIAIKKLVLDDLRALVERLHGETFWRAILGQIAIEDPGRLAFSEFELYYDFARSSLEHADSLVRRQLTWANGPRPTFVIENIFESGGRSVAGSVAGRHYDRRRGEEKDSQLARDAAAGFHYVAYHSCVPGRAGDATRNRERERASRFARARARALSRSPHVFRARARARALSARRYAAKRNCVYHEDGKCFGIGCSSGWDGHCPVVGVDERSCYQNRKANVRKDCITEADGVRRLGIDPQTGGRVATNATWYPNDRAFPGRFSRVE